MRAPTLALLHVAVATTLVLAMARTARSEPTPASSPSAAAPQRDVARPDRARAVLTYDPASGIERCPSEHDLRDSVSARLGYDPFVTPRPEARASSSRDVTYIVVKVRRDGAGIFGSLQMRGARTGERELRSPTGDCSGLLDTIAISIAIGIDPASLTRTPDNASPAELPPLPAQPGPSALPSTLESSTKIPSNEAPQPGPPSEPVTWRVGGGPIVMLGELPAPAPGLSVGASARWKWLEPTIEALATLPVSVDVPQGRVTASILAVALLPCAHAEPFFGCLGVSLGGLRGEGSGVATPLRGTELFSSATARAGLSLSISKNVAIRIYGDAAAPLTRITLQLGTHDVWTMPFMAARVGLGVVVRF